MPLELGVACCFGIKWYRSQEKPFLFLLKQESREQATAELTIAVETYRKTPGSRSQAFRDHYAQKCASYLQDVIAVLDKDSKWRWTQ